ncbi:RagB/SusD domain-containing protein [Candidatus Symbiothrix dinenymphae]|nr:RagB/SusD domain-containing protein [Candidatus Symbiothrix dinenymphae]
MKKNIYKTIIAAMCIFPSCSDYLNVVPDESFTMENMFSIREEAKNALAKSYSYLPADSKRTSTWLLGDEWINPLVDQNDNNQWQPIRIMERKQSSDAPMLGIWSGTGSGKKMYEGINFCNLFISNIDKVQDMQPAEKADWKAQVLFLKAYYHFLLLQRYGPIVIMDNAVLPDDDPLSLYVSRRKIDACFAYIVETIDKAIPDLILRKTGSEIGQLGKLAALSIKAKVLLFRASPFYSGNGDYSDFLDHDGKPFFPQDDAATTKAKWDDAVKALDEAITLCESGGVELYKYDKRMLPDDMEDAAANPVNMQTLYDLRMVICDPWNKELIWGNSYVVSADNDLFTDGNILQPAGYTGTPLQRTNCRNILGATYKTLERYYTKNGLPLDEDNTFDRSTMHELTNAPGPGDPEYAETRGILQPNAETINLYLNREPRFYANVGITGGYWRSHSERIKTTFYAGGEGGRFPSVWDNFFWSGIGAQKVVHINNKSGGNVTITVYPTPIIRLADLYLMKAEALNEYLDVPNADVYAAINKVRRRAGIPNVETVWSNAALAKTVDKHKTKEGMRAIIAQERQVEFAFEGSIFWDMIRTGKAPETFTSPAMGWTYSARGEDFFKQQILQIRTFTLRDCLWPIDLNEMNKNSNLIQNPGW